MPASSSTERPINASVEFTQAAARVAMATLQLTRLADGMLTPVQEVAWRNIQTAVDNLNEVLDLRSDAATAKTRTAKNKHWNSIQARP